MSSSKVLHGGAAGWRSIGLSILAAVLVAGCTTSPSETAPVAAAKPLEDGEVALPTGYTSWPKFLASVQRPDVKQVRDIYVNPTGYQATAGSPFPTAPRSSWRTSRSSSTPPATR